jgi:hypothetical protein
LEQYENTFTQADCYDHCRDVPGCTLYQYAQAFSLCNTFSGEIADTWAWYEGLGCEQGFFYDVECPVVS